MYYVLLPHITRLVTCMIFFQRIEKEVKKEMIMYWAIGKMGRS